jgi:hypothetical protein
MSETLTRDNLIAGDFPLITAHVTILSGNSLKKGAVLGKITASSKCVAVNSANSNGSQTPYAVLAEDADASSADVVACAYLTGEFNSDSLTFGGTDTVSTHKAALRALSIFAKNVLA